MLEDYLSHESSKRRMQALGPQLAEMMKCTYGQLRLSLMPAPLQSLAIAYHSGSELDRARAVKKAALRL
jgi:hypothetical protein